MLNGNVLASKRIAFSFASSGKLLVRFGLDASDQVVLAPKPEDAAGLTVEVAPAGEAKPGEAKP